MISGTPIQIVLTESMVFIPAQSENAQWHCLFSPFLGLTVDVLCKKSIIVVSFNLLMHSQLNMILYGS